MKPSAALMQRSGVKEFILVHPFRRSIFDFVGSLSGDCCCSITQLFLCLVPFEQSTNCWTLRRTRRTTQLTFISTSSLHKWHRSSCTHLDHPFGDDLTHLRRERLLDCVEVAARGRLVALLGCQQIFQAAILEERGILAGIRVLLRALQRLLLALIACSTCCRWLLIALIFHINVVFVLDIINHRFVAGQIHPDLIGFRGWESKTKREEGYECPLLCLSLSHFFLFLSSLPQLHTCVTLNSFLW